MNLPAELWVALVTVVGGIVTALITRNQNKLISKINEQTLFIEQEKEIRQRLVNAEKLRDEIVERMTILSMKINILLISAVSSVSTEIIDDLKKTSNELEEDYNQANEEIRDIGKEYEVLISVSDELQKNYDAISKRVKKK